MWTYIIKNFFNLKRSQQPTKITFFLYNDNFIKSIEDIGLSLENQDSVTLMENFNIMASNCGTCHKKFRN